LSAKKVIKILFVGTEQSLVDQIKSDERFVIKQHFNPLSAWNDISLSGQDSYDVIISQAYTPGLNGIDFFKYLKEQRPCERISFILITFQKNEDLKSKAIALGIDDFYEVPLDLNKLYTRAAFLITAKARKGSELSQRNQRSINNFKIPFIKRVFDIIVSFCGILILSPIFILTMIAIRAESKGNVFYKSKRVGTGYKIFDFYKFRSMRIGADAELMTLASKNQYASKSAQKEIDSKCPECERLGRPCSSVLYVDSQQICERQYLNIQKQKTEAAFFKFEEDPRITKVGNFIRKTSIDELPQLFNVLKGDMSLVGNRPLPLYEAELITSDEWSMRFSAPAGITGLWQVKERGKGGEMSAEERKALDNEYAKHNNILYDIKILFLTVFSFLQKENV